VDQIAGPQAQFVDIGTYNDEALELLRPMHEAWAGGTQLKGSSAYGLRVYQPGNNLTMHFDKTLLGSHIISSILHIDRDVDQPWPIVITGYDGQTVEVDLKPGELLFYESAKCIHGRPRSLEGRWYASLFLHYQTLTPLIEKQDVIKIVGRRHANQETPTDDVPMLRMRGTGMYEPGCPHSWCSLSQTWPPKGDATPAPIPAGLLPVGSVHREL